MAWLRALRAVDGGCAKVLPTTVNQRQQPSSTANSANSAFFQPLQKALH